MSQTRISRREAARQFFLLSATVAVPGWVAMGCGKKELTCTDIASLTPDEQNARTSTLAYQDHGPDPNKVCSKCAQFKPPPGEGQCGACNVVKGPINPMGTCKVFAPKPA